MGVKTIDEFAIRMRAALSGTGLNDRIDDSFVDSVSHMSEDDATTSLEASPWTWAAAQKRLAKAYEEGGAPRWTEQLAREAEAEARIELARRTATVEHNRRQNERPSTVA
ncbi:hypothetical protein BKA62DRAFT_178593 [Auriculariales sp. MPI-PUGE-AT-0066]|nr:hypothetical protein BKA62DRAFT_178593 [Auriculariales sp. MPI-PUGE-AT-0066]